MTVHASVELVEAMGGVGGTQYDEHPIGVAACRAVVDGDFPALAWAFDTDEGGRGSLVEDRRPVDCPTCLRLMREATDPVRYDFLRERGLVPELPLVNG